MSDRTTTFRVRVRPGAKHNRVGGLWGEGSDAAVNVWVTKRAVDGAANKAVLDVVASALGVRKHQVTIVAGQTSRTKTLRITEPPLDLLARLDVLRHPPSA